MKSLKILILGLLLSPFSAQASSYDGSSILNITSITADQIIITMDNDGVILFTDLVYEDTIDTSANYDISFDDSRSISCNISYGSSNYNIGEQIVVPLLDPSDNETGINFNLTYMTCQVGSNNLVLTGTISQAVDSNTTYHVDTQYLSVSYIPASISSYE